MSDAIQTVGAFAGIAAVIGVVVLSMLCFSMSRDLRRLRDWAGGAPERDAEVREVSEIVAAERAEELRVLAEREERRMDRSGEGGGVGGFWDRLGRTGRILAIVAAVLVIGAAAAFAGTSLLGGSDSGNSGKSGKKAAAKVNPSKTTVAVLNGTVSETGVAADYADKIEKDGYNLGVVTNTTSSYANSIVMYTKGNEAAAADVAKSVNIADTGVITPQIASLTENADVTVVVGLDHGSVP